MFNGINELAFFPEDFGLTDFSDTEGYGVKFEFLDDNGDEIEIDAEKDGIIPLSEISNTTLINMYDSDLFFFKKTST